ncbi:RCC1/BLIP-II protein [Serendipita vermifera]|nr:RCC1/BLIP-II protein [Serendipita vermifera]
MILWCAGSNANGQLATGDEEDRANFQKSLFMVGDGVQSTAPGDILQIACGSNHTLALLRTQRHDKISTQLWGVGDSSKSQLGYASPEKRTEFKQLDLGKLTSTNDEITMAQASWETSFIVTRSQVSDRLFAFGSNDFGVLGINQDSLKQSLVQEITFDHLFTGEPTPYRISHLCAAPRYVLAVLRCETYEGGIDILIGWGAARHGQLNVRQNEDSNDVSSKSMPRWISRPARIWSCRHPTQVSNIAVGQQHGLVLLNDGALLQLGSNSKLQLPGESHGLENALCGVFCSWNSSFIRFSGPIIKSYGQNSHCQLGRDIGNGDNTVPIPPSMDLKYMACGSEHCLIASDTNVLGWGWNEHGNLGMGHTEDCPKPTPIDLPCGCGEEEDHQCQQRIVNIWAGCGTSWIATIT